MAKNRRSVKIVASSQHRFSLAELIKISLILITSTWSIAWIYYQLKIEIVESKLNSQCVEKNNELKIKNIELQNEINECRLKYIITTEKAKQILNDHAK